MTAAMDRVAVARIIDPEAVDWKETWRQRAGFYADDHGPQRWAAIERDEDAERQGMYRRRVSAFARADAILALTDARVRELEGAGWQPIETAPRDGSSILAWTVHANARFSDDPIAEGWACVSFIRWIDHNSGGWTWNGLSGVHTHWQPLPAPPAEAVKP